MSSPRAEPERALISENNALRKANESLRKELAEVRRQHSRCGRDLSAAITMERHYAAFPDQRPK